MFSWALEDGSCVGGESKAVPIAFTMDGYGSAKFSHLPRNDCSSEITLIPLLNALLLSSF